ncbi:hypothetical protein [Burkholderia stabilis]|uniref:Uncharacterized protein n=1 Tax=Burkholderia stabilis TaxID=95485 RepID=A0AAJ5NAT6_9BURK|nr:hypothetical protein [Burkholderia stabilis]VBB15143.1 hypothetical protein BSTAB16_5339 [Burkholderia stabilis]
MNDRAAQPHGDELTPERVFVGISVTHETLEVSLSSLRVILGYRNETFGIESLTDAIAGLSPTRIVLESSGGAEFEVACALQAARLAVAVAHSHQARNFVAGGLEMPLEGKGARARLLAELARAFDRHPSCARLAEPLSDPQLQYVQALVQRRQQLARMLIAEYQLLTWSHASVRGGIEQTIAFLKNQIGVIDRFCARHIGAQRTELARAMARARRPGGGAPGERACDFVRALRAK